MNPTINSEKVVNYLLGSLSEAETERLDELSITDDEFAAALNAAEKDLVDAYVQGELTGATLENFRSYYLASPLRRGRLSFAQAFDALAEKHPSAQITTAPEKFPSDLATRAKRSGWFTGKGFFPTPDLAWQWALVVAAIAVLGAGAWLVSEKMQLRQQVSQTQVRPEGTGAEQELQNELERQRQAVAKTEQELERRKERERLEYEQKQKAQPPQIATDERNVPNLNRPSSARGVGIASFILMPQMRGVQQPAKISIPSNTERVSMQLHLEPNDHNAYRVSLVDQYSNHVLWRSGTLKARAVGDSKLLSISFRSGLLRPQNYVLRVSGISANGASGSLSDYPFKVVQ